MRFLTTLAIVMIAIVDAALIPQPRKIEAGEGSLVIDAQTVIIAPADLTGHAGIISAALTRMSGFLHRNLTIEEVGMMEFRRAIRLEILPTDKPASYRLVIDPNGVKITGSDSAGLMHGVQTLVQLIPHPSKAMQRTELASQIIEDWPEVSRRIFTLDTSSHMFPTADLKVLIDWLSFHKLNEFHLFLNGDAGWRMESLKFPKLHEVGSVRVSSPPYGEPTGSDSTEYGGYYTQENLRDLVAYARQREVKLIPGFRFHTGASAIIASYPELGESPTQVQVTWEDRRISLKDGEETSTFLGSLLEEVTGIFPDGVRFDDDSLQVGEITSIVGGATKSDFALYGLPATDELLADPTREARPGLNSVKEVYAVVAQGSIEATLDTELVHDSAKLQYQVFPRIAAFAEAGWLPVENRSYENFRSKLEIMQLRYERSGLKTSEIYEIPDRIALHGTKVTTSLETVETRWPELAFDGNKKTFFRANKAVKGDHLTFEFPYPVEGNVTLATGGENGESPSILADGVLEASADGELWDAATEFLDGLAAVTLPKPAKFLRLLVTGDQDHALILHEVELAEPILVPDLVDTREVMIAKMEDEKPISVGIPVTFAVNFEGHPNLRDEIATMRRVYFERWLQVIDQLGVLEDPRTPLRFDLDPSKFGELSTADSADYLITQLVPHLQNYRDDSPEWFVSGLTAMLRHQLVPKSTWAKAFPAKGDPNEAMAGGVQTAAFFEWFAVKYGGAGLQAISQDCSSGGYRESVWETFTKKPLQELLREYGG